MRCHSSVAMISRHAGMLRHCAGACVAAVGRMPLARGLTAASIATMPDGVAVVTLDQPRKRNALSMDLMQQTRSKLQAAASTPGVRVRGGCACGCGCVAMRYAAPSATDGLLVCPPAAGDCARSRGPCVQRWSRPQGASSVGAGAAVGNLSRGWRAVHGHPEAGPARDRARSCPRHCCRLPARRCVAWRLCDVCAARAWA